MFFAVILVNDLSSAPIIHMVNIIFIIIIIIISVHVFEQPFKCIQYSYG